MEESIATLASGLPPDEIERLIGRDPAADDQEDALVPERHDWLRDRRWAFRRRSLTAAGGCPCRRCLGWSRGRGAQDGADLVLHRAAVACRPQPQLLLEAFIELPDGDAGHGLSWAQIAI